MADSNVVLVRSYGPDDPYGVSDDYRSELEQLERDRELAAIARIMHQTTGIAG
jgi:hypothetical protein